MNLKVDYHGLKIYTFGGLKNNYEIKNSYRILDGC